MQDGTLDIQDLLVWGQSRPDKWDDGEERIKFLCNEWGQQFGLDGFVRMEMDLYVLSPLLKVTEV